MIFLKYAYVGRDCFADFPKWSKHSVVTSLIYFCAKKNECVTAHDAALAGEQREEVSC